MADYFPVISRAVAGLNPNTGETRRAVYERARAAIVRQLKGVEPPLPEEDIAKERMNLEEAIRRVEAEAAGREPAASRPAPQPSAPRPAPPPAAPQRPAQDQAATSRPAPAPANEAGPNEAGPKQGAGAANGPQGQRGGKGAGKGGGRKGDARPATRPDGRPIVRPVGSGAPAKKGGRSGLVVALCALAVIAVGAGLFAARGQIASLLAGGPANTEVASTDQKSPSDKPADEAKPAEPAAAAAEDAKPDDAKSADAKPADAKSDDRLPQDGAPPPAADQPAPPAEQQDARGPDATAPQPEQAAPAAQPPADSPARPGPLVAQRAVLYEEGPNQQSGEALSGTIVWRTESVAAGQNRPLETALKGDIDIPGRNLRAVLTIRRNIDATLPASHTIEIQFTLPSDFPNAGVTNVPGVLMKTDESARGAAVAGLSVKVTNGFFLIGLSNIDSEKSVNEQLLRDRGWIDIPILYDNGRRAVLTLEKGTPGKQAFEDAFDAWKIASAANPQPR